MMVGDYVILKDRRRRERYDHTETKMSNKNERKKREQISMCTHS